MLFFINSECADNKKNKIKHYGCIGFIYAKIKKIPAFCLGYFYKKWLQKKEKSLDSLLLSENSAMSENIQSHSHIKPMIRLNSLNTIIHLHEENPNAFKKKSSPCCDLPPNDE